MLRKSELSQQSLLTWLILHKDEIEGSKARGICVFLPTKPQWYGDTPVDACTAV